MKTEYRIIFTMTFPNQIDRDAAYTKIKSGLNAVKLQLPAYTASHLTKDDYNVAEPVTEAF